MQSADKGFTPALQCLTPADKDRILDAALTVLSDIGMTLLHTEALDLLKHAGCKVDARQRVKIPAQRVSAAIDSAPGNIEIYDRTGAKAMDVGGRRAYFGTGSDLMYTVAARNLKRRLTSLDDIRRAARLCDALKNIDFVMSFAYPHELPAAQACLQSFKAMLETSPKPIVITAVDLRHLTVMWQMSKIVRGSEQALQQRPFWIPYAEPISPLKHPAAGIDTLLFCARKRLPVIYSPAPIAGSTAPITLAGHLVQGLAESLFGLVVHQLACEGAPFLMGMGPAVLDMATARCSYNAPEYLMNYMAAVEMSNHLNIPNWGYAGTSDSQVPDMQASYEAGLLTYVSAVAGSNLNHDVGYLNFGLTGSLEMIVILDEVIDQIRRMQQGIPIGDVHLALDVIAEGAEHGEFLTHPHTFSQLRKTQWRPDLFNRKGHEQWTHEGATTLLERAQRRCEDILATHRPHSLPQKLRQAIDACAAGF